MKTDRPVNLDLTTIKLPIPALASILHRISGILMFLGLPILLLMLHYSLRSEQDFANVQSYLDLFIVKFIVWGIVSAFIYHIVAGLRHLIADLGLGESLAAGRITAKVTLIGSALLIILAGLWLW